MTHESRSPPARGHRFRFLTIGVFGLLAGSCAGEPGDTAADARYVSRDSSGVQLALTRWAEPPAALGWSVGSAPRVSFGESGSVDFYEIDDAVRLSDGRFVVLDSGAKELLYFSPSGELEARVGGPGDGPGEFREPAGLVELSDGTLCVFARRSQHLSLFDRDGNWLEDRPLEEAEGLLPTRMFRIADAYEGSLIINNPSGFWVRADMEQGEVHNQNYRFATDGTFEGLVGEPSTMQVQPTRVLFGGKRIADAFGGKVYVKDAARYEVRVYDYDGQLLRIHRLLHPARATSDEDVDRYTAFLRADVENERFRQQLIEGVERATLVDSFPAIGRLHVDAAGAVWVQEYEPPWLTQSRFGVFAADGPWLGSITLPTSLLPIEIGLDYLLGVQTDELDVQHLVLYSLDR